MTSLREEPRVPRWREDAVPGVVEAAWSARRAQRGWAETPLSARLAVLRGFRHDMARDAVDLARDAASRGHATSAEALAAEVLPLLDAIRFLERRAGALLAPRRQGWRGLPWWLGRMRNEVRREPHGVVLIVAPGNYPLLLAGVQAAQALAAGNAVLLKPSPAGVGASWQLAERLRRAGLPPGILHVLPEAREAVRDALGAGVDHVVLTGSSETGDAVLARAAEHGVPATAELSGCDAMFVLEDADLDRVADALAFGLRLNGGRTCCAPRRVLVLGGRQEELAGRLLQRIAGWRLPIPPRAAAILPGLVGAAERAGARRVAGRPGEHGPVVVLDAAPEMELVRRDPGAPLVALIPVADLEAALAADAVSPFHLGASVFGRRDAEVVASRVRAGLVTLGDVIVPSADPRLPFGGRGRSGYGVTRGAEGLLAMTATKVVARRGRGRLRHLARPRPGDDAALAALAWVLHGDGPGARVRGLAALLRAGRRGRTGPEPAGSEEARR